MKQLSWSSLAMACVVGWAMLSLPSAMKLAQESQTSISESSINVHSGDLEHHLNESTLDSLGSLDVQSALLARSSRTSVGDHINRTRDEELEESLDAVVSAKFFGSVVNTFKGAAQVVADAGMAVGSAVANAAVVVGNHVIRAPTMRIDQLPQGLKNFAEDLGNQALNVATVTAHTAVHVAQKAATTTIQLAGTVLEHAKKTAEQGAKLATKVGNFIADQARALGGEIAKLGPLAAGLGQAAWNEMKNFISCLQESTSLCQLLIGKECDCSAGSYVEMHHDRMELRCVFSKVSEFSQGFGIKATRAGSGDPSLGLPGEEYAQAAKMYNDVLKSRKGLKAMQQAAPQPLCEAGLEIAIDGVSQFSPDVKVTVHTNGDTWFEISGSIRASYDTLVTGQGSCSYTLKRGLPEQPKTKVICAGKFCIMISLQMVAALAIKGVLTGTMDLSTEVEFEISANVFVNKHGRSDVTANSPVMKHQEAVKIGVSADASVKLSVGPELVVWPMPGIPITFAPKMHAEAKARGTIQHSSALLLDQESDWVSLPSNTSSNASFSLLEEQESRSNVLEPCGAAAVTIYSDFGITGFGLPAWLRALLDDGLLRHLIHVALMKGAEAMMKTMTGPMQCVPGASAVTNRVMEAASAAASAISNLIPDLGLRWDFKTIQLLQPQKFFCEEVWTTPNFQDSPCASELGCKTAGQGRPDESEVEDVPPAMVTNTPQNTHGTPGCFDLPMGDRFIQLGKWRIADIDGNHFTISHQDHHKVPTLWRGHDGTTHHTHRSGWETHWHAWGRPILPCGQAKQIKFGFQFIQIGNFRIGAVDDNHFSVSQVHSKKTCAIYRNDAQRFWGPRTDWNVLDRSEGAPIGITVGDRFLQLGNFRLGDADGSHMPLIWTHDGHKRTIEVYTNAGHVAHDNQNWNYVLHRPVAPWTCKGIAEVAHGVCDPNFGSWGDRFVQIGDWRLAALDAHHFSISHKNGNNAQIYKSNGHRYSGRWSDSAWRRPIGLPSGITFGSEFIQIGNFRLAALDHDHMSISHQNGQTAQIFRGHDGSLHPGPRTDWNAWQGHWGRSAGPAGVGYGDRFLQIGNFRIGVGDDQHLLLTHTNPANGASQAIQAYKSDGTVLGRQTIVGTTHLVHRPTQWHCGAIQSILGSCPGITTGPGFIQFGDWRLAAIDWWHFSISHRTIHTSMIFTADGHHHPGSRRDWSGWGLEPRHVAAGEMGEVKLGDRFIQFGKYWRIGEVDSRHFSVSHVHGKTSYIYRADGHLFGGPRTDYNLWSRKYTGKPKGVSFGDRFVQIGSFRVGAVDHWHFSVAHMDGKTVEIYTGDGHRHMGNGHRTDWTTFGRPLADCQVLPESKQLFTSSSLVALYSPTHKRYLQLNKHTQDMAATGVMDGPVDLPYGMAFERFAVVDAGNGNVALHSALSNRFMKMAGDQMTVSPIKAAKHLPAGWGSEFFRVVDAGDGMVALHNPGNNRYVTMEPSGHVRASSHQHAHTLPSGWSWERFYMVPVKNYLQPGTMVALHNAAHNRFLRMHGHYMDGSGHHHAALPDGWTWERFRVVDAGNGMIALYNRIHNRYVKMGWDGYRHTVSCSPHPPTGSSELPNGWGSESFVPVPINAAHNDIALWHPDHHRALTLNGNRVEASHHHVAAQDMNVHWTWQTFRVLVLPDPKT